MSGIDPIFDFCIKHPECHVSFVRYDWNDARDLVKIDMCHMVDRMPYRASCIVDVDAIDNVETALEILYGKIVRFK